jgi:hypothetical protein
MLAAPPLERTAVRALRTVGQRHMPPSLNVELPARLAHLPSARQAIDGVCEQLRLAGPLSGDIRLAVSEAATDCVLHTAAGGGSQATIAVSARVEDGSLEIVVEDFVGGLVRGPIGGGGRGSRMQVVRRLADWTDVASSPSRGLRIAMRFALPEHGDAPLERAA